MIQMNLPGVWDIRMKLLYLNKYIAFYLIHSKIAAQIITWVIGYTV